MARKEPREQDGGGVALEPSLDRLVVALVGDYERRRIYIQAHRDDVAAAYAETNAVIDRALAESMAGFDDDAVAAMREDIGTRRGATYTPLYSMSPATYKRLKRSAKERLACALGL